MTTGTGKLGPINLRTVVGQLPQAGSLRRSPSTVMPEATAPVTEAVGECSATLAVGFIAGDKSATEQAIATYYPRITRTVHRLVGWSHGANVTGTDDLVQEVFVRALTKRKQFRGQSDLGTWLTRIAINVCRASYRKTQIRRALWGAFVAGHAVETKNATNEHRDLSDATREAVARLPPRYREVVVLHYLEELSVEQVARTLRLNKSTVHKRLSRARGRLETLLAPLRTAPYGQTDE